MGLNEDALVSEVKRLMMSAFQGHFKSHKGDHVDSLDVYYPRLEKSEAILLDIQFAEEEVHQELISADKNKTLGPNGFTFKFAQTFSGQS